MPNFAAYTPLKNFIYVLYNIRILYIYNNSIYNNNAGLFIDQLMPTCITDPTLKPIKDQMKGVTILRNDLMDTKFILELQRCWKYNEKLEINNVKLIVEPFELCVVEQFLQDSSILTYIRDEFNEIRWNRRNMDLYEFFQSEDLKGINLKYIRNIYKHLKNDVMPWVSKKSIAIMRFAK